MGEREKGRKAFKGRREGATRSEERLSLKEGQRFKDGAGNEGREEGRGRNRKEEREGLKEGQQQPTGGQGMKVNPRQSEQKEGPEEDAPVKKRRAISPETARKRGNV